MPNTSSNLSDKEEHLPEVEVLLATFNGQLYLSEFLESLCNQQGVKIHLRVSDDGSKDETIKILYKYAELFESFIIHEGPRRGPAANFFFLLRNSEQIFIALADQDDIWKPDHLINAITDLSNFNHIAALRFNATVEFGNGIKKNVWPSIESVPRIQNLILENQARGCTMVLNRQAVNLVNEYQPKNAVMHDWWILLQIQLIGKIVYSHLPEVNYRIHNSNFVGKPKKRKFGAIGNALSGKWAPYLQATEVYEVNKEITENEDVDKLSEFLELVNLPIYRKALRIIFYPGRLRTSFMDEIALRMILLLLKGVR
jgi:glycosyltransferase involved in cell wall biosynthesis